MVATEETKVDKATEKLEELHIDSENPAEDNSAEGNEGDAAAAAKKKKKNKKKKKSGPKTQTEPPTVPVSKIYTTKVYPLGECHDYINE